MIRFIVFILGLLVFQFQTVAQIFPGLDGAALQMALVDNYKPDFVLSSSGSKDSLYAVVENINGKVECVYTGYQVTLDLNEDPSQFVFAQNLNQEHVFPRSQGVDNTPAEFDMHHLYPSRVDVNQDRGSLPFGESADNLTNKWFINTSTIGSIPSSNIDGYSELQENVTFEPREDRKGDIARAMFYVYVMYNDLIDQEYFESQAETLCDWHHMDPVDEREWNRNALVATFQDDKPNPFILDCTLASRLFCSAPTEPCMDYSVNTNELDWNNTFSITVLNNGNIAPQLHILNPSKTNLSIQIIDLNGRAGFNNQYLNHSEIHLIPNFDFQLTKGLYFVIVQNQIGQTKAAKLVIP
jgi:hypothetical protein